MTAMSSILRYSGALNRIFSRLEILAELGLTRLRNLTRLRRAERHIFDAALLVLKLVDRIEPGFRHREIAGKRFSDLPPQRQPALLVDEPLLGVTEVAQKLLEARPVELAGGTAECRIFGDAAHDLGVGNAEPHLPSALVESRFCDHLAEHAPVEAHAPWPVPAAAVGRSGG